MLSVEPRRSPSSTRFWAACSGVFSDMVRSTTWLASQSDMKSQRPSLAMTTTASREASRAWTCGRQDTPEALSAWSPSARLTPSWPATRLRLTKPPSASMRRISEISVGRWSQDTRHSHREPSTTMQRESPTFATCRRNAVGVLRTSTTVAVQPQRHAPTSLSWSSMRLKARVSASATASSLGAAPGLDLEVRSSSNTMPWNLASQKSTAWRPPWPS
mmetsp:Transcript_58540/g.171272  ORF Transcript_58540/g.171272 Transcript_58540/m.171272 type:complete len:217 (-) Transcript_58540:427-1077(-)